ncbi:unnamed protein product [Cladocopium goreaui]|uniref:E3 ubiquitin-protein ligase TRIM71 n=1 Tax=Cladocopium goreaui TaxID=2562237 RepID=A0A9P1D085_9DINO|nr:unnamed protein product [Cladocopium goreaui]
MEIAQRQDELKEMGWKLITCSPSILGRLDDKVKLTELAEELGLSQHFPQRFLAAEEATYPCILKPGAGEFGSGVEIVHSPQEVRRISGEVLSSRWLLQEMVTGCYEYSTSLLVCEGEILEVACMRYEYDADEYVWPRVTELGKELRGPPEEPTEEQLDVMRRLVRGYSGFINFNYKIRPSDGEMCIMEAPRIQGPFAPGPGSHPPIAT